MNRSVYLQPSSLTTEVRVSYAVHLDAAVLAAELCDKASSSVAMSFKEQEYVQLLCLLPDYVSE